MPSHIWGDEWFRRYGKDLDDAINYCLTNWERYGRIGSHGKEKWGTFQHNVRFYSAWWPIYELAKPGYSYYRWPKWLMLLEIRLGTVIRFLRLYRPIAWYQGLVYNRVLQAACKKWPDIIDELIADADYPELIKGKVDGQTIHDKYWTKL